MIINRQRNYKLKAMLSILFIILITNSASSNENHINSPNDIWEEIVKATKVPGVTSAPKLQPIETRLVMLQTGMRAPMGIKVRGSNLAEIEAFGFSTNDFNNYPTSLNVTGTSTKTITLERFGLPNLTESFTDINTQLSQAQVGTYATNEGFIKTFTEVDGSITNELQDGSQINLTGYNKPASFNSVLSSDTVNEAIGKLEKGLDDATSGGVTSVSGKTGSVTLVEADISDFGNYETAFTKNTAFNKNFGTTTNTVAQGNDSRITNGQTAFSWGNHAIQNYALTSQLFSGSYLDLSNKPFIASNFKFFSVDGLPLA